MTTTSWGRRACNMRALAGMSTAAVLAGCGSAEQITAVRSASTGPAAAIVADVRLSVPGDDGALVVGLPGVTVDSASAPGLVVTAFVSDSGESRLVIAGLIADGTVVRVWGSASSGASLTGLVREAVATTLESRDPAGRMADVSRVR